MDRKNEILKNYRIYISRTGKNGMTNEELEPLILNLAYLEVMNLKNDGIFVNEYLVFLSYIYDAEELFPQLNNLMACWLPFQQTLLWDGLRDFLRNYFQSKLGHSIDNVQVMKESFNSSFHRRYENDVFISESAVERIVNILFSEDKKECLLGISPSLSEKKAYLKTTENNRYIYIGSDPDYKFEITFDYFESIEHVTLTLTNRNVRIEYFE